MHNKPKMIGIHWIDQVSAQPKLTTDFYSNLLGLSHTPYDEGNGFTSYSLTDKEGKELFGIVEEAAFKDWVKGWVAYFEVADLDAHSNEIEKLGGTIISRREHQCLFQDPTGTPSVLVQTGIY